MDAAFVTDKFDLTRTEKKYSYGLNQDNGGHGGILSALRKGQLVMGTVVSIDDMVTIDICGRNVTAPRNIFGDIKLGDVKSFELIRISDKAIELALYNRDKAGRTSFKASIESLQNWELVMAIKDQASRKNMKEEEVRGSAGRLAEIGSRMTEQDFGRLESEGFPVLDFSVSGLYEALDRVKSEQGRMEARQARKGTGLSDKAEIEMLLKVENIPATMDNIFRLQKALALSESVSAIDDRAMKHMIMTNQRPTVENIYKARYSGDTKSRPLSDRQWDELARQAAEIITEAGYEVTEENLKTARWLVDNQLPLTRESFSYKKELEDIKLGLSPDLILDRLLEGMKTGLDPKDVVLSFGVEETAARLLQDIAGLQPEAVTEAVKSGTELTIRNLVRIQRSHGFLSHSTTGAEKAAPAGAEAAYKNQTAEGVTDAVKGFDSVKYADDYKKTEGPQYAEDTQYAEDALDADEAGYANGEQMDEIRFREIRALRQLEEIRLKMSLETAAALQKKGIKVDTLELSRVVEELRRLENSYYERFFREADVQPSEEAVDLLRECAGSVEQLRSMPAYLLGSTLQTRFSQTIPGLLEEGRKLLPAFLRAGAAYETLMTVPDREYGDSIYKAFGSIPTILEELGMENTEANQRAIRILAYNRMEINEEAIRQVKAYDLQLGELIRGLHPAVAVRLIRDGINPLDMPVYELNKKIDDIKRREGISAEEKYSSFLRRLEKANGITEAERKAYIGIYRLLYNIEKSDGAAVGAVLKTGRKLTLDNLLSAVMTGKKGSIDAAVNDEFGLLDGITRDKEAISEQLSILQEGRDAKSRDGEMPVNEGDMSDSSNEQMDYYNRIANRLREEATPDLFRKALQAQKSDMQGLQQAAHAAAASPAGFQMPGSSDEIWGLVKDMPLEKLFELQKEAPDTGAFADEAYKDAVEKLRQLSRNAEQSIRFLDEYRMPATPVNLIYAGQLLGNGESPFKRILKLQQEKNVGKFNINVKDLKNFTDNLIDGQSMEEEYARLEDTVSKTLEDICSEEQTDSVSLDRFLSLRQQLGFLRMLAKRSFYQIPVLTDHGVTDVNLTIIRKEQSFGELALTTSSESLGNIKAELRLRASELSGYISCDNRDGLDRIKDSITGLVSCAQENAVTIGKLDYVLIKRDAVVTPHREEQEANEPKNPDTERILYSLAKALLNVISHAENSR